MLLLILPNSKIPTGYFPIRSDRNVRGFDEKVGWAITFKFAIAGTSGGGLGGKTGDTTVTGEQGGRRGQGAAFPSPPVGRRLIPGSRF